MTWFNLKGDARLGRCASEGCGGQPTWRLEAGGVGSNYCSGCRVQFQGASDSVVFRCDEAACRADARFYEAFDMDERWVIIRAILEARSLGVPVRA